MAFPDQSALTQELQHWDTVVQSRPNDPNAYVRRGMARFKLVKIWESIEDFNVAEQLRPDLTPYLWQRGLSYYYAGEFDLGARQFEIDLQVNAYDVEETIWRYLCIARNSGVETARQRVLPAGASATAQHDPRRVMRRVYDLFASRCTPADVLQVGQQEGKRGLFYSYLYLGLYAEAEADETQTRRYINQAVNTALVEDYMWHLACVHQTLRGWAIA